MDLERRPARQLRPLAVQGVPAPRGHRLGRLCQASVWGWPVIEPVALGVHHEVRHGPCGDVRRLPDRQLPLDPAARRCDLAGRRAGGEPKPLCLCRTLHW